MKRSARLKVGGSGPSWRAFVLASVVIAGITAGSSTSAQAPLGRDFQINQTNIGYQWLPEVAVGPDGFTTVWEQSVADPDGGLGVFATMKRQLSQAGMPIGIEAAVAGPDHLPKLHSHLGIAANGNRLVVWAEASLEAQPLDRGEVFGSLYDATGDLIFEKRRINGHAPGDQIPQAVAADGDSNFIVVWESQPFESVEGTAPSQDGSGIAVYARRLSSTGDFLGGEFRVNTFTPGDQWPGSVAASADGKFVIVWTSVGQDGSEGGIYGQRFGADGQKLGGEFRVNQHTPSWQTFPEVAMDHFGGFVVVWQSLFQDGSGDGVYARRYSGEGLPRGGEWRVSDYTLGQQDSPGIAMDPEGNFAIVWLDSALRSIADPTARFFRRDGQAVGAQFVLSFYDFGGEAPDVALSENGTMVAVWDTVSLETPYHVDNFTGVFGRRFATPFPSRCVPSETTLCLNGGRFRVEANWWYPLVEDQQMHGPGSALPLREDTGAFSFFAADNLELLVKVLDGCQANGRYWFFAGGLTNVGVDLTVVDTATGDQRVYRNSARRPFQPVQDTTAFATCDAEPAAVSSTPASWPEAGSGESCAAGAEQLCLNNGRFEVAATWRRNDGSSGAAQAVVITDDTGAFWFFREDNLELLVKVLDGCGVNGRHWVFAGGLTNVEVTLTVRDRRSGESKLYTNAAGRPFRPLQDTQAFTCP